MKINVSVTDCLRVLEKNLEEHKKELAEATEVWTEKVIKELTHLKDAVTREGVKTAGQEITSLFYNKPKDNRANYSRFIGALKICLDGRMEIDEDDYDRMFNDNWDWRIASKTANSNYKR